MDAVWGAMPRYYVQVVAESNFKFEGKKREWKTEIYIRAGASRCMKDGDEDEGGKKNDLDAMSKQWRCAAMTRSGSGGSLPPCTSKKESTTTDMDMDGYRWTMDHDERD